MVVKPCHCIALMPAGPRRWASRHTHTEPTHTQPPAAQRRPSRTHAARNGRRSTIGPAAMTERSVLCCIRPTTSARTNTRHFWTASGEYVPFVTAAHLDRRLIARPWTRSCLRSTLERLLSAPDDRRTSEPTGRRSALDRRSLIIGSPGVGRQRSFHKRSCVVRRLVR